MTNSKNKYETFFWRFSNYDKGLLLIKLMQINDSLKRSFWPGKNTLECNLCDNYGVADNNRLVACTFCFTLLGINKMIIWKLRSFILSLKQTTDFSLRELDKLIWTKRTSFGNSKEKYFGKVSTFRLPIKVTHKLLIAHQPKPAQLPQRRHLYSKVKSWYEKTTRRHYWTMTVVTNSK